MLTVFIEMPSALAADLSVWPSAIRYTTRRSASISLPRKPTRITAATVQAARTR